MGLESLPKRPNFPGRPASFPMRPDFAPSTYYQQGVPLWAQQSPPPPPFRMQMSMPPPSSRMTMQMPPPPPPRTPTPTAPPPPPPAPKFNVESTKRRRQDYLATQSENKAKEQKEVDVSALMTPDPWVLEVLSTVSKEDSAPQPPMSLPNLNGSGANGMITEHATGPATDRNTMDTQDEVVGGPTLDVARPMMRAPTPSQEQADDIARWFEKTPEKQPREVQGATVATKNPTGLSKESVDEYVPSGHFPKHDGSRDKRSSPTSTEGTSKTDTVGGLIGNQNPKKRSKTPRESTARPETPREMIRINPETGNLETMRVVGKADASTVKQKFTSSVSKELAAPSQEPGKIPEKTTDLKDKDKAKKTFKKPSVEELQRRLASKRSGRSESNGNKSTGSTISGRSETDSNKSTGSREEIGGLAGRTHGNAAKEHETTTNNTKQPTPSSKASTGRNIDRVGRPQKTNGRSVHPQVNRLRQRQNKGVMMTLHRSSLAGNVSSRGGGATTQVRREFTLSDNSIRRPTPNPIRAERESVNDGNPIIAIEESEAEMSGSVEKHNGKMKMGGPPLESSEGDLETEDSDTDMPIQTRRRAAAAPEPTIVISEESDTEPNDNTESYTNTQTFGDVDRDKFCVPCRWIRTQSCSGGLPCDECRHHQIQRKKGEWVCYYDNTFVRKGLMPEMYRVHSASAAKLKKHGKLEEVPAEAREQGGVRLRRNAVEPKKRRSKTNSITSAAKKRRAASDNEAKKGEVVGKPSKRKRRDERSSKRSNGTRSPTRSPPPKRNRTATPQQARTTNQARAVIGGQASNSRDSYANVKSVKALISALKSRKAFWLKSIEEAPGAGVRQFSREVADKITGYLKDPALLGYLKQEEEIEMVMDDSEAFKSMLKINLDDCLKEKNWFD